MKTRFLLLFLMITLALTAQSNLEKEELKGKVKTVIATTFSVDDNSQELTWINKSSLSAETRKTFDEEGELIKEEIYNQDGELYKGSEYVYDENGHLVKILDSSSNGVTNYYVYFYDEDGNRLGEEKFDALDNLLGKFEFEYDENGHKIKSREIDTQGNVLTTYEYANDEDGNALEQKIYRGKGLVNHSKMEYDANGNLTHRELYDSKGNLIETNTLTYTENDKLLTMISDNKISNKLTKYIYVYDENDEVSHVEQYENDELVRSEDYKYNAQGDDRWMKFDLEGVVTTYRYDYKYDDKGNWTEKLEYMNDQPDTKYIRKITYYE